MVVRVAISHTFGNQRVPGIAASIVVILRMIIVSGRLARVGPHPTTTGQIDKLRAIDGGICAAVELHDVVRSSPDIKIPGSAD